MKSLFFALIISVCVTACAHTNDRDPVSHESEGLIEEDAILSVLREGSQKNEADAQSGSKADNDARLEKDEEKEDSLLSTLDQEAEDAGKGSTEGEEGGKSEDATEVEAGEIRKDPILSEAEEVEPPSGPFD